VTRPTDAGGDGITKIFRKEALQRLSSSERLDQLMQVVGSHDWLGLATALALVAGGDDTSPGSPGDDNGRYEV
jgi:hypothetical protein